MLPRIQILGHYLSTFFTADLGQVFDQIVFINLNSFYHHVKSVLIHSYSGPYLVQMRTRINPNTDTFYVVCTPSPTPPFFMGGCQ